MKNILLSAIMLLVVKAAISQNYFSFPDSSASWYEVSIIYGSNAVPNYSFGKYELGGSKDTSIISGKVYHKVYYTSASQPKVVRVYFREENKKVLGFSTSFSTGSQEKTLYDFNLHAGDSFVNAIGATETVSTIDSILIQQHYRRKFNFNPGLYGQFWIEGIGSSRGIEGTIYPRSTCLCDGGHFLVCYYMGDTLMYHNPDYYSCTSKTDNVSYDIDDEVILYPNPVIDKSYLYFKSSKKFTTIEFYSIKGVKVKSNPLLNQERFEINRIDFVHGIYFYRLLSDEKICVEGKFVVQ